LVDLVAEQAARLQVESAQRSILVAAVARAIQTSAKLAVAVAARQVQKETEVTVALQQS
jgi:hypothetical protein